MPPAADDDPRGEDGHRPEELFRPYSGRDLIVKEVARGNRSLSFVIDPWTQRWAILEPGGERILKAADGSRTVAQIVDEVVSDAPSALADPDAVADLTLDLFDRGLLTRSKAAHSAEGHPVYNTSELVGIHLEVTNACNLRCEHCYVSSGKKLPGELSDEELRAVVDQLPQSDVSAVVISGGEPTVRRGCMDLVSYCAVDRGHHVDLYTNGYKFPKKFVTRLIDMSKHTDRSIRLQISLEGARPETNDRVRGGGAFEATLASLRRLQEAGLTRMTTIFVCVTKFNIEDVGPMIELCEQYEIDRLHFSQWQRQGNASETPWGSIAPDLGAWIAAGEQVLEYSNPSLEVFGNFFGDLRNTPEGQFTEEPALFPKHLYFYNAFPRVAPDGKIFADQLWTDPDWALGNVRDLSLAEAFESAAFHDQLAQFRNRLSSVPQCQRCEWSALCECGSPGHTYAEYGHMSEKDLFCDTRIVWFERYLHRQVNHTLDDIDGIDVYPRDH